METENTPNTEVMETEIEGALVVMEEEGALTVIDQSKALVVSDIESKKRSITVEQEAKKQKKRYMDLVEPFKKALKARHTNACAKQNELVHPFDEVIANEGRKRATYDEDERVRLAKEAAERAEIEAAERAERLQAHQTAITERVGQHKSSEETIELLNLMLHEDGMTDEKAGLIRSQIETEQAVLDGINREAAQEAAEAKMVADAAPSPPAASLAPKSKGEVTGYAYKVTVTDMKLLCQAIGEGKVPTAAVKEAQGKLNSYAKDGIIKHGQFGCSVEKTPTSFTRQT